MDGDRADVLVIGAGPSGGVAAMRFLAAGMRVVCLEQGAWPDRHDYPGNRPEAELLAAKPWSSSPAVRNAAADYPVDLTGSDLGALNFNGVGGGTVLYNGQWPRMLPDDFRVRTIDGVADDWPLTYDELQPFYEETDRQFGISGLAGNPRYPDGDEFPLPPLPIGALGTRVARAHAELGWHWWPAPNAIASTTYAGRQPCVQRGTCGSGCNEGAKASADLTHWAPFVAAGGVLRTGARVRRVVLDGKGRACGAEWIDGDGHQHFQAADVVVMASNAIGTARLLLASATTGHPDGLANSSGLVGRRLMLHPLLGVSGLFEGDDDAPGWRAHNGALIQSLQFADSDRSRGFVRGATWALGTAGGPLRAVFAPGPNRWGAGHHRHVAERFGRTASWVVIVEDLPDDTNRVELSALLADADGVPAPVVRYRLGDNTRRLIAWHAARATESLLAAGASDIDVRAHPANGHFMGTARMGDDPATSVVDRWGRCHDIPNLLIVDGSVFVTAGSANPTSTIVALALRAADHLAEHRGEVIPGERGRSAAFDVGRPTVAQPVRISDAPPAPIVERSPVGFDTALRARLALVADQLIPAGDGMPSASQAGVHLDLLDRFLAARPDLAAELEASLWSAADGAAALDELPVDALRAIRYAVAGAYYLSADVRARLGWQPDDVRPVRADRYPEYIAEGLLDHVLGGRAD